MPTAAFRTARHYTIYVTSLAAGLSFAPSPAQAPVTAVERPMFAPGIGPMGTYAMAYDGARECVVLHDADMQSTWEWYGAGWQRRESSASNLVWMADAMTFGSSDPRCLTMDSQATWAWDGETWSQIGPSLGHRFNQGFAYDSHRDRTVFFGGWSIGPSNQTWEFDGTTWQQIPTATQPPAGSGSGMVFDSVRGCMVVVDGVDTWEWDGSSWTLRQPVNSPGTGWFGMAFDTARGVTVLPTSSDIWEWDGVNWTSTPAAGGPHGYGGSVVYDVARAELVVVETGSGATWSWDGMQWTHRFESSRVLESEAGMATDPIRQRVVAFGGLGGTSTGVYRSDATLEWHDGHWQTSHPNTVPARRRGAALCFDSNRGRITMFGGDDGPLVYNDLWSWNGNDWTAMPISTAPPARPNMAIAYDTARDRIVMFGGGHRGNGLCPCPPVVWADTWEWDGINWSQITPPTNPAGRLGHHMAYDASRGRTVLFGGETSNGVGTVASDETWEWDGGNWQQQQPTNRPPGGSAGAMMFDPTRGKAVFYFNDLWQWDGTNWTTVPTATTLPMAYWTPSAAIEPTTGAVLVPTRNVGGYGTLLVGNVAPATSTTTGSGCAGSSTTPHLRTPTPLLGDPSFRYELGGASPSSPALLVWASTIGSQSIAGCTLHLGPQLATTIIPTNSFGVGIVPLAIPADPLLRGFELHAQGATLDFATARGFALTNAQRIRIGDGE